jgi:hypothetical protein
MKLDLINSRFPVNLGCRIYDSIEGELVEKPLSNSSDLSKASFLSKQSRIHYAKKERIPDRFDTSVVDAKGNYLPLNKSTQYRSPNSKPKKKQTFDDEILKKYPSVSESFDQYPSMIASYLKDHIYDVKEDSVKNRLESGKLPGGVWDLQGRKSTPPKSTLGPGSYEVYDSNLTSHGRTELRGGHFNTAPCVANELEPPVEPDFLPLKERQRYYRCKAHEDAKHARSDRSSSTSRVSSVSFVKGGSLCGSISLEASVSSASLFGAGAGARDDDFFMRKRASSVTLRPSRASYGADLSAKTHSAVGRGAAAPTTSPLQRQHEQSMALALGASAGTGTEVDAANHTGDEIAAGITLTPNQPTSASASASVTVS